MRTARFLAAIAAPLLVVACAVGTAPVDTGSGVGTDGGVGADLDGNYGTTGDGSPTQAQDSGTTNKDSGTPGKDGGTTVIDSGGGGGTGDDCVGDTDSSGTSYNTDCEIAEFFGDDEPCTPGGSDCAGAGECCYSNMAKSCIKSNGPQCEIP